jgi:hypothetical protein
MTVRKRKCPPGKRGSIADVTIEWTWVKHTWIEFGVSYKGVGPNFKVNKKTKIMGSTTTFHDVDCCCDFKPVSTGVPKGDTDCGGKESDTRKVPDSTDGKR